MIQSLILGTTMFYQAKIFQGEILQGCNMVYLGPIDPYFLAVILISEPHFPQNFDPWALKKKLIPSMFLHKILTLKTLFISKYRI